VMHEIKSHQKHKSPGKCRGFASRFGYLLSTFHF
jgi:hypothetical protein